MELSKMQNGVRSGLEEAVISLISAVPASTERQDAMPGARARVLARSAAKTAAGISGGAALIPGPIGLLTVLPDVYGVWKVQAQMVADIAAVFGKSASLNKEQMLYCLFKHTASQFLRDLVVRSGERYLVRLVSAQVMQGLASKIGLKLSQRAVGKSIARFVPLIGAIGVGSYAYYDTNQVARTAMELFSREAVLQDAGAA